MLSNSHRDNGLRYPSPILVDGDPSDSHDCSPGGDNVAQASEQAVAE